MPQNLFERMMFALITVVITVHAFVFYNLYVVSGSALMTAAGTGRVLEAIRALGGVYMFGHWLPVWAVILVEFACAYTLENLMGSPMSFRLASRCFDPRKTHPVLFEAAIISATVGLLCPVMSFLAAWMYYPYYEGFDLILKCIGKFKAVTVKELDTVKLNRVVGCGNDYTCIYLVLFGKISDGRCRKNTYKHTVGAYRAGTCHECVGKHISRYSGITADHDGGLMLVFF